MHRIDVTNHQSLVRINARRLRQAVRRVLEAERIPGADVSVAVVDDVVIRRLNRRHLGHDYATDVLSFLLEREVVPTRREKGRIEGEVVVSAETARRRAAEFGWHASWELLLYVVHGCLHLCGYDDQTRARQQRMRERERMILAHWGMTVRYAGRR
jgi:probable rRNA maturation factor